MEEIERELGVCKIPSLESHPEYPEFNVAVAQFSFSNADGPQIWVPCHSEEIVAWDTKSFAKQKTIRGTFDRGSITLFRSNPQEYIFPNFSRSDCPKTHFPTPAEVLCVGEMALRHPPEFPGGDLDDIRFNSIRFSLDHLTSWMADVILKNNGKTRSDMHSMAGYIPSEELRICSQLATIALSVSVAKDYYSLSTSISATSTIQTEIELNFKDQDGIGYSEAMKWVCLFQSVLSIASESPSNLKYFYAKTSDRYAVEIYPQPNRLDDGIMCLKHKEVENHLQDEQRFEFGMFIDFENLGVNGLKEFLNNIAGEGNLDIDTLEYLAILANHYFTDYPRGFGHVELFGCAERIAGNPRKKSIVMEKVSQKAREIFDSSNFEGYFDELDKWAKEYRNNIAHGLENPLPYDEADLTEYLKLVLSCHLLSSYADKSIWKRNLRSLFRQIEYWVATK